MHLPAGRAIALAAMPSALLVGMGLTPNPAQADDPAIPFAPGPCVTQPEESEEERAESGESGETGEPGEPGEKAGGAPEEATDAPEPPGKTGGPEPETGPGEPPAPGPTPPADGGGTDPRPEPERPGGDPEEPEAPADPRPEPEPERPAEEERDLWDPLGLGDALRDLLDGPGERASEERRRASGSADPGPATSPSGEPRAPAAGEPADDPAREAARDTERAIREVAKEVGAEVEELDEATRDTAGDGSGDAPEDAARPDADAAGDAAGGGGAGDGGAEEDGAAGDAVESPAPDGRQPYPCPTPDPEALAAAELEPGLPLLADEPWRLEATRLTLTGLDYHGIVEVRTAGGKVKKVLKFTSDRLDIKDLHQIVREPGGPTTHVRSTPGSTSVITGGTTLYTEELKGNLFGLIPITFSPRTPPPLNVPFAFFTEVSVVQAAQFGGTLTIPGMSLSSETE
ncbi:MULTISPECIES: hypothetical protein [Streptomyces]|uniref:hypothetical protein n=1 Tax=Streptomyces TaxID=1883 RepID=UPI002248F750|nr:hypothetical protein [Streptomyces sp. JHD 1]MCX2967358.1 hypothetical protein [Streptomyces sp. JHD 1]